MGCRSLGFGVVAHLYRIRPATGSLGGRIILDRKSCLCVTGLLAALGMACTPLHATVSIVSMTPSLASPQALGTTVTWTVKATDTSSGPLTFQFNVRPGSQPYVLARDFNKGTLSSGTWTAQPFAWTSIVTEGSYTIEVVAKDFTSGESATMTAPYTLTTRVRNGNSVVHQTTNALIALFSAPACASGSSIRVAFYTGTSPLSYTNWVSCSPRHSMNFYVAGMLPSTTYTMYSQVETGSSIVNGNSLSFTTSALPARLPNKQYFATFNVNIPPGLNTDTADSMLLWSFTKVIVPVVTDLNGNIIWYYPSGKDTLVTRPLAGGTLLTIQDGPTWGSKTTVQQLLREIDLAGNTLHETNTGIISQQLMAMGATDAAPCASITNPKVGDACLDDFHHDAIRLPNGYTAFFAHIEKLYPAGTQGSTTGQPVDILSEILIVLDTNWQVKWYFETFQHAGGAPQLDINRPDPLGETCTPGAGDCPTKLTLASTANDWTHSNAIYYIAAVPPSTHDYFMVSVRDQDWIVKVDYNNATGTGNILWRMGPGGDFTFNNINNDPWPWFSHQHEPGLEGGGILTLFDNGNTRVSPPPVGLGSGNSRGMALRVNESKMQVTPVLSVDLGVYSGALGSAQLLSNGNYFFLSGIPAYSIEILPTPGTTTGTQVLNVGSPDYSYRGWQMSSLYAPPTS
jgi:arylsulfate sulfotransferase